MTVGVGIGPRQTSVRLLGVALLVLLQLHRCEPLAQAAAPPQPHWYFSCRHTYEDVLTSELRRTAGPLSSKLVAPGLVRVEGDLQRFRYPTTAATLFFYHHRRGRRQLLLFLLLSGCDGLTKLSPLELDIVYALQVMPHCRTATGESIKDLAASAVRVLTLGGSGDESKIARALRTAPRGSLAVHALVPDVMKGAPKPKGANRAALVADEARKLLSKSYKAARRADGDAEDEDGGERWLLQLLLLDNHRVDVSLAKCGAMGQGAHQVGRWPTWHLAAGLADVDIEKGTMPSSAYRKLLEAFHLMEVFPQPGDVCVDLGACPGGWTAAMMRYGAKVVAIDRSPVEKRLTKDGQCVFISGDAFAFDPFATGSGGAFVDWPEWPREDGGRPAQLDFMVSDVIAFPERVPELLSTWCGNAWAKTMVVTMKFKEGPDYEQLANARKVAAECGYSIRVKHFFNNKNEVTLMLRRQADVEGGSASAGGTQAE